MADLKVQNNYNLYKVNAVNKLNNKQLTALTPLDSDSIVLHSENKSEIRKSFEKIKEQQGIIGKLWDGFKNIFGMKSGSKYLEKLIKRAEKGEISQDEVIKAVEKYKDGQKMCLDVAADIASGILSIGAFTLAVPTGGASLAIGLTLSTTIGAGVKVGIKAVDSITTGKDYTKKDLIFDSATGAINGLLGPVTNGLGNSITKTIGKKFGLKIIGESAQKAASCGIKSAILNQSIDVAGGTVFKRAAALGAGMALDGALSGASDNMVRAALNGENVTKAGIQGAIGGLIMAPVIGGGFRIAGKAGNAINNKITTKSILPDGLNTTFKQGQTGDCALLSTIDGLMNNADGSKLIKNSITKTPFGDYHVKIGDKTVTVAKSAISDELLADTKGIKIFEQAYKQLTGNLDGDFADSVAKQLGLNPIHITKENITDEILDKIAKEQNNTVLSLGTLVDNKGYVNPTGTQRHYFTIKNIDSENKIVKLTSSLDTSKVIELSYDDVKRLGLSIDGGSLKETSLPCALRQSDDISFFGIARKEINRSKEETERIGDYLLELDSIKRNGYTSPEQIQDIIDDLDNGFYRPEVSAIEYQKIKNTVFQEFANMNSVEIGGRQIPLSESQKKIYDKLIKEGFQPQNVSKGYYEQVIMSDAMFLEAMGVNLGLDVNNKSALQIFEELSNLWIEGTDVLPGIKITNKNEFLDAFLGRQSVTDKIYSVGSMSGDKAVHEANKALMALLDANPEFKTNWINYCNNSSKFKQFCALADTYKTELRYKLHSQGVSSDKIEKLISSQLENEDHLIFRALQRDFLFDSELGEIQQWSTFESKNFIDILCEKILGKDTSENFLHGILSKYGNKFDTLVYKFSHGSWDKNAVYIPQYSY